MEASIRVHSIRSELEETSGGRRPDVCRPKDEKSDEMKVKVKAVETSHSAQAKRLLGTIAETRKELREGVAQTPKLDG
jgi:hypothetical protein